MTYSNILYIVICSHFQMEMVFQHAIPDVQLCGAKFVDFTGDMFGVTGYDCGEVVMFSKQ